MLVGHLPLTYNRDQIMPILEGQSLDFLSHSPEQTVRLGVRLGELIQRGDVICLSGDLGSGKTTLAQGIARGWGSLDQVTSPSFILINEYRRADNQRLFHLDAFRMNAVIEADLLGFHELLDSVGSLVIEWPERIQELLPADHLWVSLRWVDELRRGLNFIARGNRYEHVLEAFRTAAFGQ
jgi:tRNA threonylcarbamoyladenosine biosynthesis protein TsaE